MRKTTNFKLPTPRLWSPEDPHLYTLEVSYNGMKVSEKVGIREVTSDAKKIYVNGKEVYFNGMCWNEIMPDYGRAIPREARKREMERMKALGVNMIRTAHYPFGVDFYELADEMGFYVIDEIPCGSRGGTYLKRDDCLDQVIDRCERTIRRDQNHPSVIIWSFGNENFVQTNTIKAL